METTPIYKDSREPFHAVIVIALVAWETRVNLNTFTYTITSTIVVNATLAGKTINYAYKPELKITLKYAGNRIEFEELLKTDENTLGTYNKVPAEWTLTLLNTKIGTNTI